MPTFLKARKPSAGRKSAVVSGFATRAVHAGEAIDPGTGAVSPAIHPSATFALPDYGPGYFEAATL